MILILFGFRSRSAREVRETGDPVRMDDLSEEVLAELVKYGKIWRLSAMSII